jgi:hypothetical protein
MIWLLIGGKTLEPRFVRTGLTNGRVTEILGGDINEGDVVIVGQNDVSGTSRPQQPTTPFGGRPPMGGRGR